MNKPIKELAEADQELARIQEQQEELREEVPFNALAHLCYEMGTVVEFFQVGKIRNLENKCNTE